MVGPARGRAWTSPVAEVAVLAAEVRPVPLLLPSVAQTWLRPSQPRQLPSPPSPKPPEAVDRDRKRIMQTHSWVKLVPGLRSSKGGVHEEPRGGPGAHAGTAAAWDGGGAAASPGCRHQGPPPLPIITSPEHPGSAPALRPPEGTCWPESLRINLAHLDPGLLGSSSARAGQK